MPSSLSLAAKRSARCIACSARSSPVGSKLPNPELASFNVLSLSVEHSEEAPESFLQKFRQIRVIACDRAAITINHMLQVQYLSGPLPLILQKPWLVPSSKMASLERGNLPRPLSASGLSRTAPPNLRHRYILLGRPLGNDFYFIIRIYR